MKHNLAPFLTHPINQPDLATLREPDLILVGKLSISKPKLAAANVGILLKRLNPKLSADSASDQQKPRQLLGRAQDLERVASSYF